MALYGWMQGEYSREYGTDVSNARVLVECKLGLSRNVLVERVVVLVDNLSFNRDSR